MPLVHHRDLTAFCRALFEASGAPPDIAGLVADSLVGADLRGIDSHGVMRTTRYLGRIRDGSLQPAARPSMLRQHGASIVLDGGWGFGQVAARHGARLAIELCREHGLAGVSLSRSHHIGRLGEYAEMLAAAGHVGLVLAAGGERGGSVAVHGSRSRMLGTNPLAIAVPSPLPDLPLVLDFATSTVPEGRVAVARANGTRLPPGCLLDAAGRPSTDPADFYAGGALVPFGGHKGSALMLMIEILATTMAGSAPISSPEYRMGNPAVIIAWSVDYFTPHSDYHRLVRDLMERIKQSDPAEGFSEVLLPGEIEARRRREREQSSVPVTDGVWEELSRLAAELKVAPPRAHAT